MATVVQLIVLKLLSLLRLIPLLPLANYHLDDKQLLEECWVILQYFVLDQMVLEHLAIFLILVYHSKIPNGAKVMP